MDFIDEFNNSYERILGPGITIQSKNAQDFFEYFYQLFIKCSPEAGHAFRNTDMDVQQQMLKRSLLFAVSFQTCKERFDYMEQIAKKHSSREYNIAPDLYDLWLDCMIASVAKFDPQYNDGVELAWRLALGPAITYMKFMYDK